MFKIGIDLDHCINSNERTIEFFSAFTAAFSELGAFIYIITNREPGSEKEVQAELDQLDIVWHQIEITAEKAKFIIDRGITIYFDDTDEYFLDLPESVCVFKIREEGNFDFNHKKWIYGDKTGINVDSRELV
tara:strand:+ start:1024 stop:1419 length:396 start_codon:yes stop_codon:yes gene_type:complete